MLDKTSRPQSTRSEIKPLRFHPTLVARHWILRPGLRLAYWRKPWLP
jgi:hypothetical protein